MPSAAACRLASSPHPRRNRPRDRPPPRPGGGSGTRLPRRRRRERGQWEARWKSYARIARREGEPPTSSLTFDGPVPARPCAGGAEASFDRRPSSAGSRAAPVGGPGLCFRPLFGRPPSISDGPARHSEERRYARRGPSLNRSRRNLTAGRGRFRRNRRNRGAKYAYRAREWTRLRGTGSGGNVKRMNEARLSERRNLFRGRRPAGWCSGCFGSAEVQRSCGVWENGRKLTRFFWYSVD